MNVKRQMKMLLSIGLLLVSIALYPAIFASANEGDNLIPVTESGGYQEFVVGGAGSFQVPETYTYAGQMVTIDSANFYSTNPEVLFVNEAGAFCAVTPGYASVTVDVYAKTTENVDDTLYMNGTDVIVTDDTEYNAETNYLLFTAYYQFYITPDLSGVTIDKTSQTLYISENDWVMPSFTFHLNSDVVLNAYDYGIDVTYASSNADISVMGYLENNVITLVPSQIGKTTVTITINEKVFTVNIKTVQLGISKNSLLMSKGQTKQLKIKGIKKGIKWSSSNTKIATVSSTGKVKAKKNGNVVIKATIGDISLGCAVSVVSPKQQKVINRASKIAQTSTYSQAKRMQNNYYDCSSLVWKAYSKYGVNFGSANYAPVAANIGKWCATNKKLVKGGLSQSNVEKMKLNAGDLMFETSANKARYRGIYHVEMISGYVCYGFDSNDKPILAIAWANRPAGYYWNAGQMVGRPSM